MSTHHVYVVRIGEILPHPNADRLEVTRVGNYVCVVGKGQFAPGDLAAYIPPDYVVPPTPAFAFLGDDRRVTVRRYRGTISQGLLVPAPPGAAEGDDVMDALLVTRYEPPLPMEAGGEFEKGPDVYSPKYDVQSWYDYPGVFQDGEVIAATEKLDGASGRVCWADGRLYVGSRTQWMAPSERNLYWRGVRATPAVEAFCREHHDLIVYGEFYGWVQSLRYGAGPGECWFSAFDLLRGNEWVDFEETQMLAAQHRLPWVPVPYVGPYSEAVVRGLAEGETAQNVAGHVREGVVIKPLKERTDVRLGRAQLKLVGDGYYEEEKRAKKGKRHKEAS